MQTSLNGNEEKRGTAMRFVCTSGNSFSSHVPHAMQNYKEPVLSLFATDLTFHYNATDSFSLAKNSITSTMRPPRKRLPPKEPIKKAPPPKLSPPKLSPLKGLDQGIPQPFARLNKGTWLHGRSETDVYRVLIDAYRLHAADTFRIDGLAEPGSLYAGTVNALPGLRRFLERAAETDGLLPDWWDETKKKACERLGVTPAQWYDLKRRAEKRHIANYYEDDQFPAQLRLFAEAIYGTSPGNMCTSMARGMLVAKEQGPAENIEITVLKVDPKIRRKVRQALASRPRGLHEL